MQRRSQHCCFDTIAQGLLKQRELSHEPYFIYNEAWAASSLSCKQFDILDKADGQT